MLVVQHTRTHTPSKYTHASTVGWSFNYSRYLVRSDDPPPLPDDSSMAVQLPSHPPFFPPNRKGIRVGEYTNDGQALPTHRHVSLCAFYIKLLGYPRDNKDVYNGIEIVSLSINAIH